MEPGLADTRLIPNDSKQLLDHTQPALRVLPGRDQPENIQKRIDGVWNQAKPFLKKRYRLKHLSSETSVPMHQLSLFFNKVKGQNFIDFLNHSRIEYCIDFLNRSEVKRVNLGELSEICGFNNRNTFTVYFKKVTGNTPSEFIRTLK
jgi:YesN/AraC family two-component response regulator